VTPEERKRRNYVIAGAVGGFLLPLAGVVGAMVFYQRDDPDAARTLAIAAVAGLVAYLVLFSSLG
jgi:zinc transporter ZupT